MEGRRIGIAAVLAALAAVGCCGLTRAAARGNRDTPEASFEFVRAAFAEDRTGDQYDSFHPSFRDAQGISQGKYSLARTVSPGLFEKARRLLGSARLEHPVELGRIDTRRDPADPPRTRDAARVVLSTPEGRGVFHLVDEPSWLLATDDEELPSVTGFLGDMERSVRVEGDRLVVEVHAPLDPQFRPLPGSRVRRVEFHHDWLLYGIESLEGFEEFLGEVKAAAERASEKEEAPR